MIQQMKKGDCSGCGACSNICPQKCITMKEDNEGFFYPEIEQSHCIKCRLCEQVCPSLNKPKLYDIPVGYACINKDRDVRMKSSSGGVFSLLAEYILDQGGVVFGAAFSESSTEVRHVCIEKKEELSFLRGSKYVQSRIGDTYKEAERFLKEGRSVLYTGTPCQISGLKSFLQKDYDTLYTQDLICHGAPSPLVWKRYLLEKNRPVQTVSFRDKRKGWLDYSISLRYTDQIEENKSFSNDLFMKGFLTNIYLRPSCYQCNAKGLRRCSDITLADFWEVEELMPELFDDKGTSLVLVHSEKGRHLLKSVQDKMIMRETDLTVAIAHNTAAVQSVILTKRRKRFYRYFRHMTVECAVEKTLHKSLARRGASKIKRMILGILRKG